MDCYIRRLQPEDLSEAVEVIRRAFATVAEEFALTPENCPGNGAFITLEQLTRARERSVHMTGLFVQDRLSGFVAWKPQKASSTTWYLEKLAVPPELRRRGYGEALLRHARERIAGAGGRSISIGVIDENHSLIAWYEKRGFVKTGVKQFAGLPFLTCYLEWNFDL